VSNAARSVSRADAKGREQTIIIMNNKEKWQERE
jgi:hypothetical protein